MASITGVILAEVAALIQGNEQAIIDKAVAVGDAGLDTAAAAINAADHIPIIGAIIKTAVGNLTATEKTALPTQIKNGLDTLIALLNKDAGVM